MKILLQALLLCFVLTVQAGELTFNGIKPAVIVDVRSPQEFVAGHIEGAVNIPRGVLEFQVDAHPALACAIDPALQRKDLPLVVVCRSGGRAALAADSLQAMGFADVRSIAGGVLGWQQAGLPLV